MTNKHLEKKAKRLCRKFYEDAQELFDDKGMNDELASGDVFSALMSAQGYAEDAANAAWL